MNASGGRFLFVVVTVLLAAVTALFVTRWTRDKPLDPSRGASEADFHQWMHEQLVLTADQHAALEPIEAAFEKDRSRIRSEITIAGQDLADAVRKGKSSSAEIDSALTRLNAAQASLQRVTLDHFFAMRDHLDPEQAEKLLHWTHDSILSH